MKNKVFLSVIVTLLFLLSNCTSTKIVTKETVNNLQMVDPSNWSLDDCNTIIKYYKTTNYEGNILSNIPHTSVKIEVIPLNKDVVSAFARKETIEKRYTNKEFLQNLKVNLDEYTSYTLDTTTNKIIIADTNFTNGYSFKTYFENIYNPFKPIFLEDGYSYFFLENEKGDFSRVLKVTGMYAEDYIQLDGYLNVVMTFSPFADNGKRLFTSKDLVENYRLVFNGLQKKPIILEWKTD